MPMLKPFSSPSSALLWSYWRLCPWWVLFAPPVLSYSSPLSVTPAGAQLYLGWLLLFVVTAGWLDVYHRVQRVILWLPISPRRVVLVESGLAVVWMTILTLGLWLGSSVSISAPAPFPLFVYLNALLAGLMAVALVRCADALGSVAGFMTFLVMALTIVPVVRAQVNSTGWSPVTFWTMCAGVGVLGLHVILLRLDRHGPGTNDWSVPNLLIGHENPREQYTARSGTARESTFELSSTMPQAQSLKRKGSPAIVKHVTSPSAPMPHARPISWNGAPAIVERFNSPITAQAWYEARFLLGGGLQRVLLSLLCAGLLILYISIMQDSDPGNPVPLYVASYLGLILVFHINTALAQPGPMSNRLPLSIWNHSRACFLLYGTLLALVCVLLWGIAVASITTNDGSFFEVEGGAAAPTSDLGLLAATLWSGWVSVALGATYFINLEIAVFLSPQQGPQTDVGVLVEVALLIAFVLAINWTTKRRAGASTLACLASAALVVAGYSVMARYPLPPQLHWFCREAFGTLLVLAMLRHYTSASVLPPNVGRLLTWSLLAGALFMSILVFLLGAPPEPTRGILPIYLALGVVPPIFLPLMFIPHLVCWNRNRAEWLAKFRKDALWMR